MITGQGSLPRAQLRTIHVSEDSIWHLSRPVGKVCRSMPNWAIGAAPAGSSRWEAVSVCALGLLVREGDRAGPVGRVPWIMDRAAGPRP